jgi:RNA polymerase sigma factor (sigma-70 family)
MKVFISWSGERSQAVANALRDWLAVVIQSIELWMSQQDISAGQRWGVEIANNLRESNFGIICLTSENKDSRWLLFESGALAKQLDESRVVPLLLGMQMSDIEPPLSQFQAKKVEKDGIFELVQSINELTSTPLPPNTLKQAFDGQWESLKQRLDSIPETAPTTKAKRSQAEILEELVMTVRGMDITISEMEQKWFFSEWLNTLPKVSTPRDPETEKLLHEDIIELMESLTPQQRDVLRLRHGLDSGKLLTHNQVAQKLGITPDEVASIETKALTALRRPQPKTKERNERKK